MNLGCFAGLSLVVALLSFGCVGRTVEDGRMVAKVKDRVLTAAEVDGWISSQGGALPVDQRSAYIRQWVEEEVLYQAAIDKGILHDPWVSKRLDELTRKLTVARFIELESSGLNAVDESQLRDYFNLHRNEFVWPDIHLVVDYWHSSERRPMERLREQVVRGAVQPTWTGGFNTLQSGHIAIDGEKDAEPGIWKIISSMRVGQVSSLEKIQDEWWIFRLTERREPGEMQSFDDVRNELNARLMEIKRNEWRETLIRELTDKYRRSGELIWNEQPSSILSPKDTAR